MASIRRVVLIAVALALPTGWFASTAGTQPAAATSPLVVAFTIAPDTLDPQASPLNQTWLAWQLSYECLVRAQPDGKIIPWLATRFAANDARTVYDFTLRRGVKFHNGATLAASDVVFTFNRLRQTGIPYAKNRFPTLLEVTAPTPNTVRFTLSRPDPGFLLNMGDPFAVSCAILSARAGSNLSSRMVGTGPWAMESYAPTRELKVKRFTGYWGKKTGARQLRVLYVPEASAQLVALQSGKVDLIFPDAALIRPLQASKGIKLKSVISAKTLRVEFNVKSAPLDDVNVRRAIELAIDRPAAIRGAYLGYGAPASYIPRGYAWAPSLGTYRYIGEYDVGQARQLLARAGVPNGFKTTYMYIPGTPAWDRFAQILKSQLSVIGIDVALQPVDTATYLAKLGTPSYDLAFNQYPYFADPLLYVNPRPNRNGTVPADVQELVNAARAAPNHERYLKVIQQLALEQDRQGFPNFVVASPTDFVAFRSKVEGVKLDFSGSWTFLADITVK